ncbi:MAG: hypothetical protein WAZ77_24065, partial [Candidatus Nitrosopolaris sp.]
IDGFAKVVVALLTGSGLKTEVIENKRLSLCLTGARMHSSDFSFLALSLLPRAPKTGPQPIPGVVCRWRESNGSTCLTKCNRRSKRR